MTIASIDIGTNTVLLLIAELDQNKQLNTILNEYRIPRIGKRLLPGSPITIEKIDELITVLESYKKIIKSYKCQKVLITATNAFRIASNSQDIVKTIQVKFGWDVNIVTGEDEAYLSYLGATTNIQKVNEDVLVIDIGGGSTELIFGEGSQIKFRKSFHTGVVSGTERFFKNDPPESVEIDEFEKFLNGVFLELTQLNYAPKNAIALAGTPTTLACMIKDIKIYNDDLIEGCRLEFDEICAIKDKIKTLPTNDIVNNYGAVIKGRQDLILAGSVILLKIMELRNITNVIVSTKGIRYGAIIKQYMQII